MLKAALHAQPSLMFTQHVQKGPAWKVFPDGRFTQPHGAWVPSTRRPHERPPRLTGSSLPPL